MTNREIMVDELAKEVIKGTFGDGTRITIELSESDCCALLWLKIKYWRFRK